MIVGADACSTCLVALKTGVASTVLACGPSISWIQAPEFCTLRYVVVDVVLHGARPAVPLCLSLALIVLALLGRLPVVQGSVRPRVGSYAPVDTIRLRSILKKLTIVRLVAYIA